MSETSEINLLLEYVGNLHEKVKYCWAEYKMSCSGRVLLHALKSQHHSKALLMTGVRVYHPNEPVIQVSKAEHAVPASARFKEFPWGQIHRLNNDANTLGDQIIAHISKESSRKETHCPYSLRSGGNPPLSPGESEATLLTLKAAFHDKTEKVLGMLNQIEGEVKQASAFIDALETSGYHVLTAVPKSPIEDSRIANADSDVNGWLEVVPSDLYDDEPCRTCAHLLKHDTVCRLPCGHMYHTTCIMARVNKIGSGHYRITTCGNPACSPDQKRFAVRPGF